MKNGTILIDVQQNMLGVSLLVDGQLKEHYVEYKNANNITGNIYRGRVVNVLRGLQSAFVDIGRERNGFLSVEETLNHKSVLQEGNAIPSEITAKSGDYILVQATKEEISNKGARLTANVSIAGRYVVYLPTLDFVGVSNKITDGKIRDSLTALLCKHKTKNTGLIARTVCLEAKKSEIVAEIKQLKQQWKTIEERFDSAKGICKIYDDGDIVFRTIRDILSDGIDSIVCNDLEECELLRSKLNSYNPRYAEKLHFYDETQDMYQKYDILSQVDTLLQKKVKLPSGGSLVFDYTEALTVIDVNTCKYTGSVDHEDTVFCANLEAATEIARQIRLRNIGGIIIIDFIDMSKEEHKQAVMQRLRDEMLFDRTKVRVADMTALGLVEVIRKKTGRELSTVLLDKCPHCEGNALTYSNDYLCRKIKSSLAEYFCDPSIVGASVRVHERLADYMIASRFFDSVCMGEWYGKRIYVIPNDTLTKVDFVITPYAESAFNVPSNSRLLY